MFRYLKMESEKVHITAIRYLKKSRRYEERPDYSELEAQVNKNESIEDFKVFLVENSFITLAEIVLGSLLGVLYTLVDHNLYRDYSISCYVLNCDTECPKGQ